MALRFTNRDNYIVLNLDERKLFLKLTQAALIFRGMNMREDMNNEDVIIKLSEVLTKETVRLLQDGDVEHTGKEL